MLLKSHSAFLINLSPQCTTATVFVAGSCSHVSKAYISFLKLKYKLAAFRRYPTLTLTYITRVLIVVPFVYICDTGFTLDPFACPRVITFVWTLNIILFRVSIMLLYFPRFISIEPWRSLSKTLAYCNCLRYSFSKMLAQSGRFNTA